MKGLALAATVLATIALTAGCGDADPAAGAPSSPVTTGSAPSPTPSPTPSVAEVFTASAKHLATTPYAYTLGASAGAVGKVAGAVDPSSGNLNSTVELSLLGQKAKLELRVNGKDYWARFSGVPLPDLPSTTWIHLDPAKLSSPHDVAISDVRDPIGIVAVVKAATATERTADGTVKGTIDLTKVDTELPMIDADDVVKLRDKAKAVPFQAKLDASGRLTTFTFTVPEIDARAPAVIDYAVSDVGTPVTVEKPTGRIVEATAKIYKALEG